MLENAIRFEENKFLSTDSFELYFNTKLAFIVKNMIYYMN